MSENLVKMVEKIVGHIKDQIAYENDGNVEEVLAELNEAIFALDTCGCGKFIDEIEYQIGLICEEENLCPNCHSELETGSFKEVHTHLDDQPCEVFIYNKCPQCNWDNRMD